MLFSFFKEYKYHYQLQHSSDSVQRNNFYPFNRLKSLISREIFKLQTLDMQNKDHIFKIHSPDSSHLDNIKAEIKDRIATALVACFLMIWFSLAWVIRMNFPSTESHFFDSLEETFILVTQLQRHTFSWLSTACLLGMHFTTMRMWSFSTDSNQKHIIVKAWYNIKKLKSGLSDIGKSITGSYAVYPN